MTTSSHLPGLFSHLLTYCGFTTDDDAFVKLHATVARPRNTKKIQKRTKSGDVSGWSDTVIFFLKNHFEEVAPSPNKEFFVQRLCEWCIRKKRNSTTYHDSLFLFEFIHDLINYRICSADDIVLQMIKFLPLNASTSPSPTLPTQSPTPNPTSTSSSSSSSASNAATASTSSIAASSSTTAAAAVTNSNIHLRSDEIYETVFELLFKIFSHYGGQIQENSRIQVLKQILILGDQSKWMNQTIEEPYRKVFEVAQRLLSGFLFVSRDSQHAISFFKIIKEVEKIYGKSNVTVEHSPQQSQQQQSQEKKNWFMNPFLQYVQMRKESLIKMIQSSNKLGQSPTFCKELLTDDFRFSFDELYLFDYEVQPFASASSIPKPKSLEWTRRVQHLTIALALSNCTSSSASTATAATTTNASPTLSSTDLFSKFGTYFNSQMLQEAILMRILQLLDTKPESNAADFSNGSQSFSLGNMSEGVAGKWVSLCDKVYYFISKGMISFQGLLFGENDDLSGKGEVLNLKYLVDLYGDQIRSFYLCYFVLQTLPAATEVDHKFIMYTKLMELLKDLRIKKYTSWNKEELELVKLCLSFIFKRLSKKLKIQINPDFDSNRRKQLDTWWNDGKTSETFNYYEDDKLAMQFFSFISSFLTAPLTQAMETFLTKKLDSDLQDDKFVNYQTNLHNHVVNVVNIPYHFVLLSPNATVTHASFEGKRKPLSISFLSALSTHTRKKLFASLEQALMKPFNALPPQHPAMTNSTISTLRMAPPSIPETYVRILYLSPMFAEGKFILSDITTMHPSLIFIVLEMINYRLIRFMRSFGTLKLIKDLVDILKGHPENHKFQLLIENIFIKIFNYFLQDVHQLYTVVVECQVMDYISDPLKRVLFLNFVRLLDTKISLQENSLLVETISKVFIGKMYDYIKAYPFSQTLSDYFSTLLSSVSSPTSSNTPITKAQVDQEMTTNIIPILHTMKQTAQRLTQQQGTQQQQLLQALQTAQAPLIQRYNSNPALKQLFLCCLWKILYSDNPAVPTSTGTGLSPANTGSSPSAAGATPSPLDPIILHSCKMILFGYYNTQEFNACVAKLVQYIFETFLVGNNNSEEIQVRNVGIALTNFVFQYQIIPFQTILLHLIDRFEENPISVKVAQHLLSSEHFLQRLRFFYELNFVKFWDEPDYFQKHALYHEKYPDLSFISTFIYLTSTNTAAATAPTNNTNSYIYPSYYGNLCLQMLPVFEVLMKRLVQLNSNNQHEEFILRMIDALLELFLYHEFLITMVRELLRMENLSYGLKKRLLTLLTVNNNSSFSPEITQYSSEIFDSGYFSRRMEHLNQAFPHQKQFYRYPATSSSTISSSVATALTTTPAVLMKNSNFEEFDNEYEKRLNFTLIEILALPFSTTTNEETITYLLKLSSNGWETNFNIGVVLSLLLHYNNAHVLLNHVKDELNKLAENKTEMNQFMFQDNYQNHLIKMCHVQTNPLLAMFHAFTNYANMDFLVFFLDQLFQTISPPQNILQIYLLCKLIGPCVPLISSFAPSFYDKFVKSFMKCIDGALKQSLNNDLYLNYLNGLQSQEQAFHHFMFPSCSTQGESLSILNDILDFLNYCLGSKRQSQQPQFSVASTQAAVDL